MITPTGATVAQYWQAIKDRNPAYIRMTFPGGTVLDNSDIEQGGLEVQDILNGETDLAFGKAVMKTLNTKIFLSSKTDQFSWSSEFTLELGIDISGTTNWVQVGVFSGAKPENYPVNGVVEFEASDRMKLFDVSADDFLAGISYPITFSDMYHNLCTYVGIQYEAGNELANIMSRSFASAPITVGGLTCRDILALMAEACGCYAKITPTGKVKMVWYADQTSYSVPADEEFQLSALNIGKGKTWQELESYKWEDLENLTWEDLEGYNGKFHINALSVQSSDDDVGVMVPSSISDGYIYYIVDNPFLYHNNNTDVANYITPIYNRLDALGGYLPMTVDCTGNWLVETGDIITVDFHGESVSMPLFARTLVWKGTCKDTYEATGDLNRQNVSVATHEKLTSMGRFHEIKRTIDGNFETIQDEFGNYYTKAETATYISLQLTDYYGKVSGITIDTNGVAITGSKYVKITAATNYYWNYTSSGLTYCDSSNNNLLRVGSMQYGASLQAKTGFYNDIDDTGSMLFVASKNGYYSAIRLKYDNSYMHLIPCGSTAYLGDSTHYWVGYMNLIYGYKGSGNGGSIALVPSIYYQSGSNGIIRIACQDDGTKMFIDNNGGNIPLYFYGTYVSSSSVEIKHDIHDITDVGERIDSLHPVSFIYDGDQSEQTHFGLIYEEMESIIPEICVERQDENSYNKSINYVEIVPLLIKEIQSLRHRVSELETEVTNNVSGN